MLGGWCKGCLIYIFYTRLYSLLVFDFDMKNKMQNILIKCFCVRMKFIDYVEFHIKI